MRFTPKTEREIAEEGLLAAGEYDATITEAEETTSKAGNEMIVLKLRIFRTDREGFAVIRDYLLESMAFKLRHCAEACRILNRYEQGTLLAGDFVDRDVRVVIGIKKDKSGQYPDQNVVKDYLAPNGVHHAAPAQKKQEMVDDEIPF